MICILHVALATAVPIDFTLSLKQETLFQLSLLTRYVHMLAICAVCDVFTSTYHYRGYHLWSCQNVSDALSFLLDNTSIKFGTKLYRQIVGIPMGTNCAPLVAYLFLFCYERDFMEYLSSDYQADVIKAFNSTSRYLDDLLS